MTERPTPPSGTRDTVSGGVEEAVLIALAKLPVDRFAGAAEFAPALGGEPTAARRTTRRAAAVMAPGRWRTVSAGLSGAVVVLAALAAWALTRTQGDRAPAVFDAGLPDSALMFFSGQTPSTPYGSPMRTLSLAPDGSFVVYLVQAGASTMLWRRDLREGNAAGIPGTDGGTLPRLSPDGTRLAFVQSNHVMVLPIGGGPARRLIVICSLGGIGRVIDPVSGTVRVIRSRGTDPARATMLSGSAFRVIGDRYLVSTSPEGDLRAAPYDPGTTSIGRSVPLVTGVRRESIGTAQFDGQPVSAADVSTRPSPTATASIASGGRAACPRSTTPRT